MRAQFGGFNLGLGGGGVRFLKGGQQPAVGFFDGGGQGVFRRFDFSRDFLDLDGVGESAVFFGLEAAPGEVFAGGVFEGGDGVVTRGNEY